MTVIDERVNTLDSARTQRELIKLFATELILQEIIFRPYKTLFLVIRVSVIPIIHRNRRGRSRVIVFCFVYYFDIDDRRMAESSSRMDIARSPKASHPIQPTPFSIDHILSGSAGHGDQPEARHPEEIRQSSVTSKRSHGESGYERASSALEQNHRFPSRLVPFPRLPVSPDCQLNVARELDILRRNLTQANLTNFGNLQHAVPPSSFKSLETLGSLAAYHREVKEAGETAQRLQDEALDMSKNKYLGKIVNSILNQ